MGTYSCCGSQAQDNHQEINRVGLLHLVLATSVVMREDRGALLVVHGLQRRANQRGDVVKIVGIGGDVHHSALVVLKHRGGLGVELLESRAQFVLRVVAALDERLARDIINHLYLRRVEVDVVGAARGRVDDAASDASDEQVVRDNEVDDAIDGFLGAQQLVQDACLRGRPRKAIEDEAVAALIAEHRVEIRDERKYVKAK